MKKAFTVVEIMIVVVIIGLLAAMAVPAYVKVKTNNIAKRVYHGERVSREEYTYLERNATLINEEYRSKRKVEAETPTMPEAPTDKIFLLINGKRYKLVEDSP